MENNAPLKSSDLIEWFATSDSKTFAQLLRENEHRIEVEETLELNDFLKRVQAPISNFDEAADVMVKTQALFDFHRKRPKCKALRLDSPSASTVTFLNSYWPKEKRGVYLVLRCELRIMFALQPFLSRFKSIGLLELSPYASDQEVLDSLPALQSIIEVARPEALYFGNALFRDPSRGPAVCQFLEDICRSCSGLDSKRKLQGIYVPVHKELEGYRSVAADKVDRRELAQRLLSAYRVNFSHWNHLTETSY